MRLKLFRGASMAEAMAGVRGELGAEALILSTRRIAGGIEITAALESGDEMAVPSLPPRDEGPEGAHGTPRHGSSPGLPPRSPCAPPWERGSEPGRERVLAFHGVPSAVADRLAAGPLAFALAAAFRFAPVPVAVGALPLLVAGPPGAGKTLTVARLASRLVLRGTTPLVITADGQRAGATEQLAAFTRLLGLDLIVACSPEMIMRALTRRVAGGPVLIDAPGTDAFDHGQQDALRALADGARATVALVMPAGVDPVEAADVASAYRETAATLLVANRLDGARRLGGILAAAATGLAMSEAGIGPGAADGLVPLTPALLAARLMQFSDQPA